MEAWKLFMLTMQVICTKYRFCLKNSGKNSKFSCDFEFFLYFFWMKLWVITRCSSRKNSWEKSYKSTKPSYSSGTILQVTAEKEKSYYSSRKIYSRNPKNNYFRKIFGKVWLHEFQISNIYSHSAATSEKEWILSSHIAKFKSCRSRASITYQIPRRWRQYRWSKT